MLQKLKLPFAAVGFAVLCLSVFASIAFAQPAFLLWVRHVRGDYFCRLLLPALQTHRYESGDADEGIAGDRHCQNHFCRCSV